MMLTSADAREFFAPRGTLSRILPDYRERPEQSQMAECIQAVLQEHRHGLIEAGTGVGKSLAYLIPGIAWALEHKARLVISTHTKALQAQLVEREIPRLMEHHVFPSEMRCEIGLGAENYVCLIRLLRIAQAEQLSLLEPHAVDALRALLAWCQLEVSGIRQDAPEGMTSGLWRHVGVINELCLGRHCPYFQECFWFAARKRQQSADVLVVNHSLFFSDRISDGRVLPEFQAAILDEAHKLEDVAAEFFSDSLSQSDLQQQLVELSLQRRGGFLHTLPGHVHKQAEQVGLAAQALVLRQDAWWLRLRSAFPPGAEMLRFQSPGHDEPAPDVESLRQLADQIASWQEQMETEEEAKVLALVSGRLHSSAYTLERWHQHQEPDHVYWADTSNPPQSSGVRIMITPLDLNPFLRRQVFQSIPTVILCSATLTVNRSFTYLRSRLGVPEAQELVLDSPFPYASAAALYLPQGIPDPKEGEAFEHDVLNHVMALIRAFAGGVFVLFTSYRFLRRAAQVVRAHCPEYDILVQGESDAPHLLRRFQNSQHAVMMGVETFWQGVDVPGEALRCVAITRLPFDVPTHPLHQARMEQLESRGQNAFQQYALPRAVFMLRQGFGRLIRRHGDWGVVAILDPRVHRRWGKLFLQALPECEHMQSLEAVEGFISRHTAGSGQTVMERNGDQACKINTQPL